MKAACIQLVGLAAIAASLSGCAYSTSADQDISEPVSSEQALASHRPICTKVGTAKEGWRWADTNKLIRHADCEGLTPRCQYVGSRSEGWYADGLIAWDMCAAVARVHRMGEACGPSIGFSCDTAGSWCHGLPPAGVIGGSGICQPYGFCSDASECSLPENQWVHDAVPGFAQCVDSQCVWIPEDCHTTADCLDGYACTGIPSDGSTKLGKCRSTSPVEGEGATCTAVQPCGEGLGCIGLSMGDEGWCVPSWMLAEFTNAKTYGTTSNVVVYGQATVPVDIVVSGKLNKNDPSKLTLQLTDPNGVAAIVCSPATAPCTKDGLAQGISVEGNSRDDQVNGRWTLQVKGSGAPKIVTWTLHLSSRWD